LLKVILAFILISTAADLITGSIYGYFSMALPFNCFNAFAIGSLYSYVRLGEKEGILIRKALILLLPVALILYVLSKAAISLVPQRLVDAIIAVNLLMYVTEARYGKVAGFIIDNKMLNNLGRISYGVYLYHYIIPPCYYSILAILEKKIAIPVRIHTLLNHPGMVEMISFSVLITLSYLSYHLIEVKFLKVKKYFKYSEVNAVSAVDVPSVT
jgi:peptidoglycan/LPS O-acetylase OafA/YrhL